jgi:hypothetical protein
MKAKKLLILTLAFSVLGIGSIVAGSPWGEFEGYPKAKVNLNGSGLALDDVPAFVVDGEPVVPVKSLAHSLQSLVTWDATTSVVDVYKPNIHMFVGKEVTRDGTVKQSFGKVQKGDKVKFVVFAQADELKTKIHSFQIQITDPSGAVVGRSDITVLNEQAESFWYPWPFDISFDQAGKYRVKFLMKQSASDEFMVVSEKLITAE